MSIAAVVDIAVYLDSLTVFEQKLPGSLRLALSIQRKATGSLLDKVQAKPVIGQAYRTADRSLEEADDVAVYCSDLAEGDVPLQRAAPYILTDSFFASVEGPTEQAARRFGKTAFFRLELPSHPALWGEAITLKVELLMKPQVLHVDCPHQFGGGPKFERFDDLFVRLDSRLLAIADPLAGSRS